VQILVAASGKTVVYEVPGLFPSGDLMSSYHSELVAIARLNGDFRKNYGKLIGAYLYLRSITAAGGRRYILSTVLFAASAAIVGWIERQALTWLHMN
jgi:hypothetical protein